MKRLLISAVMAATLAAAPAQAGVTVSGDNKGALIGAALVLLFVAVVSGSGGPATMSSKGTAAADSADDNDVVMDF
ncbi:hypothetical protein [Aliiroseovarius subalbicans]|uniref:hypothetical protein n=1 Tax=Aliiroseovarius subalbicans TaxID=2925840 RepID=UPI001F57D6B1|nr:hypothetical protein [Aliiroseovarius subalbicans]MCI2398194.1 hypothetical protein [Aliiroseovarius subalbicans]